MGFSKSISNLNLASGSASSSDPKGAEKRDVSEKAKAELVDAANKRRDKSRPIQPPLTIGRGPSAQKRGSDLALAGSPAKRGKFPSVAENTYLLQSDPPMMSCAGIEEYARLGMIDVEKRAIAAHIELLRTGAELMSRGWRTEQAESKLAEYETRVSRLEEAAKDHGNVVKGYERSLSEARDKAAGFEAQLKKMVAEQGLFAQAVVRKLVRTSGFTRWLQECMAPVVAMGHHESLAKLKEVEPTIPHKHLRGWNSCAAAQVDYHFDKTLTQANLSFPLLDHLIAQTQALSIQDIVGLDFDEDKEVKVPEAEPMVDPEAVPFGLSVAEVTAEFELLTRLPPGEAEGVLTAEGAKDKADTSAEPGVVTELPDVETLDLQNPAEART